MPLGILGEFCPADDILAEFIPQGIHGFVQPQLSFILHRGHSGKQIILLVRLTGKSCHLHTQLPQRCHAVPCLVKDPAGGIEDLAGDVGGTLQLCLVRIMLKFIGAQVDTNTAAAFTVLSHPAGHGFAQTQQNLIALLMGGNILGRGHRVAVAFVLRRLRGHGIRVAAVGEVPNGLAVLAETPFQQLFVRLCQIPDGINSHHLQLSLRCRTHQKQIPHRQGPHFRLHLLRKQSVDFVRLFKVPRHFRQQFIG